MDEGNHTLDACKRCAMGRYQPRAGMSECWTCPGNSTSKTGSGVCTLNLPCATCIDRPSVKIRAVVHGQASDAFWRRVKRAMFTAARHMKVDFDFYAQTKIDSDAVTEKILAVAEEKPDVLLVTIPNDEVLSAVKEVAQKVHVFTFNAGTQLYLQTGSHAHFGMDDRLAGERAAAHFQRAFEEAGSTFEACAVVNYEAENDALVDRKEGYMAACQEMNVTWLGEVKTSAADSEADVAELIRNYSGGGLGVLLLGAASASGAKAAFKQAGRPPNVKLGVCDLDSEVTQGIADGSLAFGISQNEWLQGFLSVVLSTVFVTTGHLMVPTLYPTGPRFVTEAPTVEEAKREAEAFPVCDCPWAGGFEADLECSAQTPGVKPIGECPTANDCEVDCVDPRDWKLRGVCFAHEADTFFMVVNAGANQAANDLRLKDFEFVWFGPPGSDRPDAFTNELFADTIGSVARDPSVDAMFVAIQGAHAHHNITFAASKMPVVTMNAGVHDSESLNPPGGRILNHVGPDDRLAGEAAARRFVAAGAQHIMCLQGEVGTLSHVERCGGVERVMEEAGKKATIRNLEADGVDAENNNDAVKNYVMDVLRSDPTLDAILTVTSQEVAPVLQAIKDLGKQPGSFWAASYDSNGDLVEAMRNDDFFMFSVDQQPYMQGYVSVMLLYAYLLSGQKLQQHQLLTGPSLQSSYPSKDLCIGLPWLSNPDQPVVGEPFLPAKKPDLAIGFPVCPYTGTCEDYTSYFDSAEGICKPCPPGTYKNQQMTKCAVCPDGTSTNFEVGSSSCKACLPGSFAKGGDKSCVYCSRGQFSTAEGSSSCESCKAGFTTADIAQSSNGSCMCPEGSYGDQGSYSDGGRCLPCPEGMVCPFGSDVRFFPAANGTTDGEYPRVAEGYMSLASDPLQIYYCPHAYCPGGPPGTCSGNRDPETVACGLCLADMYADSDGECYPCEGSTTGVALLVSLLLGLFIAGLAVMAIIVNRDVVAQTNSKVAVIVMAGLMFSGLQVLSVFSQMSFEWVEPVRTILQISSFVSFDFKMLPVTCVYGQGAVMKFAVRQFVAPFSVPFVVLTLTAKRYWIGARTNVLLESINTIGVLFSTFFIPITISSLAPLIRFDHPGDSGESVVSLPSILFMGDEAYDVLLAFGIAGFLLVPVPFVALCTFGTLMYPSWIGHSSASAAQKLLAFRFLFSRFRPPCYHFGLAMLARSLLLCLVPVVFSGQSQVAMQVVVTTTLLCGFTLLQMTLQPWRNSKTNSLDGILNMCMVLLLMSGSLALGVKANTNQIQLLGTFYLLSALVIMAAGLLHAICCHCLRTDVYDMFVCHHKAGAAAQARLLKTLLQEKHKKVFIDSDDLTQLDELFDLVKSRVRHLVVYLTSKTLTRPWCAGEIATSFATAGKVKITAVRHPSFAVPSEENLSELSSYLDLTSCSLAEYHITMEQVANSFRKLLSPDTPCIIVGGSCAERFECIADELTTQKPSAVGNDSVLKGLPQPNDFVVIASDANDDEALAATQILAFHIKAEVAAITPGGICCTAHYDSDRGYLLQDLLLSARAVVVLLTKDSLVSPVVLSTIISVVESSNSEEAHKPELISMFTPDFSFPNEKYYREDLPGLSHHISDRPPEQIEQILHSFFKAISMAFSTHASEKVIAEQTAAVVQRVPKHRHGGAFRQNSK